jgi:hypothetical protein
VQDGTRKIAMPVLPVGEPTGRFARGPLRGDRDALAVIPDFSRLRPSTALTKIRAGCANGIGPQDGWAGRQAIAVARLPFGCHTI